MPNVVVAALLRLAIVVAMKFSWIFVCLFVLSACHSGTTAPEGEESLAWKVLKKGKGHPGEFDTATMNYAGWTSEDRMFDSTERQGQSMVVTLVRIRRDLHQVR